MIHKKNGYKSLILKELYFSKDLSCPDLCHNIHKSLPLVTQMVNDLVKEGVVVETGLAPSSGGRRPLQYAMRPDAFYILAVSMDQYVTRIGLLNMQNQFIGSVAVIDLRLYGNPDAFFTITQHIAAFIEQRGLEKDKIVGIGIGMPGFVDIQKGSNYSFWGGPDSITDYIASETGLSVFIDNDSSLIALAELRLGAAMGKKNVMVVNLGWGVGLGMILNGKLYRGEEGFAGEFSHIPMFTNNKICSCGKYGCLETETSLLVLIEKAKEALAAGHLSMLKSTDFDSLEEANNAILRSAAAGDQVAIKLLSEIGFKIGRGVSILIHLLNPQLIILSGRGAAAGRIWQAPIQQALNEFCIPRLAYNTQVEVSGLGHNAELIGAAALVMENFEHTAYAKVTEVYTQKMSKIDN
jgi:predicted NBD/HSP70 family sugar kinase